MSINSKMALQGVVAAKQTLIGAVTGKQQLSASVNVGGTIRPESYKGEYEVTPTTSAQILETSQKFLEDDVTVKEIPYAEVTNLANGITVTIGSEV